MPSAWDKFLGVFLCKVIFSEKIFIFAKKLAFSLMKNYYYILGISSKASLDEIKKAYRKLATKFHPDKNQGDSFFEERFKEIQEAYEVLSGGQKADYDAHYASFFGGQNSSRQYQNYEEEIQKAHEELKRKERDLKEREERLKRQEEEIKKRNNSTEEPKKATESTVSQTESQISANAKWFIWGFLIFILFSVVFWVWKPWKKTETQVVEQIEKTENTNNDNTNKIVAEGYSKKIPLGLLDIEMVFIKVDRINNAHPCYISTDMVTQAQWKAVIGDNPSHFKHDNSPVVNISWYEIQVFLEKLNKKTGKKFRLPFSTEWLYAEKKSKEKERRNSHSNRDTFYWIVFDYYMNSNLSEFVNDNFDGSIRIYGGSQKVNSTKSPIDASETVGFRLCLEP